MNRATEANLRADFNRLCRHVADFRARLAFHSVKRFLQDEARDLHIEASALFQRLPERLSDDDDSTPDEALTIKDYPQRKGVSIPAKVKTQD